MAKGTKQLDNRLNDKTARRVPRGDRRRAELAAVAERTFLKYGFSETTMQMIASEAGSSKETLYRHFSSKDALFTELINARAAAIAGPQSSLASDAAPEQALMELGTGLMRLLIADDAMFLLRIVIAEAHRAPNLGRILYQHGPGMTLQRLTDYLRAATRRGQLRCKDPQQAAKLFLGSVTSHYHLLGLIGKPAKGITAAEMRLHVRAAVDMFLSHYAA
jgi:AcrR family transcriptional regulator